MRKLLFAAALAGTMLGSGAMAAQTAPEGRGGGMMRADTNGDGMISRAEYMAQADQRFARLDKNGDGYITADEMGPMADRGPGGGMMAADTDHDGKISHAEYSAMVAARFAKLDTNGDGQISPDEMTAARERMREHGGGFGGRRGAAAADGMTPPPPGAERGAAGPHHGHGARMMERLDTNHDGRISRDEMRAEADRRFDKLDTNHDGFIDKAEMDAMRTKMKGMRGWHGGHHGTGDTPPSPPADGTPRSDTGQ